ncbi:hypothetical protein A9Q86_01470 [Flavobacteriales bacterium 33_180_T64]|nr:hypothetical protein A9Q86_01470 [Flavobacteriales bacterium 33_180_T64]
MKRIVFTFFILMLGQLIYCQEMSTINIPLNKEMGLDVLSKNKKIKKFDVIFEKETKGTFNLLKVMSENDTKNVSDIYIRFGKAKFGNSESTVLIIRHKLKQAISYKARIKVNGEFSETSVVLCHPNVASIEQWNEEIEEIQLYDFKYFKE